MDRERPHEESVSVEISGCSKEDARIVFDTLSECFESDRASDEVPQQLHESRAGRAQGSYWAIERLRSTLDSVFAVRDLSSASGDQERELHVLLESR